MGKSSKKYDITKIFIGDIYKISVCETFNNGKSITNCKEEFEKKTLLYKNDSFFLKYVDLETGKEYWADLEFSIYTNDSKYVPRNQDFIYLTDILSKAGIRFKQGMKSREEIILLYNKAMEILSASKTFAIIKPDGMKNIEKIIEMIYKSGLKIDNFEVRLLDENIIDEHYSHLLDKPFYPKLKNYMMSGEVALMVLSGDNAVEKLRELMGPTDSTRAEPNTIRGKFGTDITYNAIHGSDSKESAEAEINRFFNQKQKRISR